MIYDMNKTFHENISQGLHIPVPTPLHRISETIKLFDYEVLSPIGLFACPFSATSQGVALASQLGFDVITWKTIRSSAHEPHPWPNLSYARLGEAGMIATQEENNTLVNSIGNASYELDPTLQEIAKGLNSLQQGQILISSIYGTGHTHKEIINDFVYLAQRVNEVGVHAIELNCSCPNVSGAYYKDNDFMRELVAVVTQAVSIPITIKVGIHDSRKQLEDLLLTITQAGARGISGINAIGMKVLNEDGAPFFGENRLYAGMSGEAIRSRALAWVRDVAMINKQNSLDLTILGGGGIIAAHHFDEFFDAGADISMIASGALLDPNIAINYHRTQYEKRNPHTVARSEHVI